MIDQGPWGMFWRAIGEGSFDLAAFRAHIRRLPTDPRHIKAYIETLHSTPVGPDAAQVFLLLQACAIGGKAISITDGAWRRGAGFRDYWLPTAVSSRRSPVNPMMPMPATILDRVETIARRARGLIGICGDASLYRPPMGAVGYIDPPYRGTTGYPYDLDAIRVAMAFPSPCWVSEALPLPAGAIHLSTGRTKGGITGNRRVANDEWLSPFSVD